MSDADANTPAQPATDVAAKGPEIPRDAAVDHQPPQSQSPAPAAPQNPSRDDAILTALAALPEKLTDAFKTLSQPPPPPPVDEVKVADVKVDEPAKRRTFSEIWFGK